MSAPTGSARQAQALLRARPDLAGLVLSLAEPPPTVVTSPPDAHALFVGLLSGRETEAFAVAALDRRMRVIEVAVLTTGSDEATVVDVRQVLRWVLTRKRAARAFIVAHNHPSGDPTPSNEDRAVTRRLAEGARAVGLALHDHVIVGAPGQYTSFALLGLLAA